MQQVNQRLTNIENILAGGVNNVSARVQQNTEPVYAATASGATNSTTANVQPPVVAELYVEPQQTMGSIMQQLQASDTAKHQQISQILNTCQSPDQLKQVVFSMYQQRGIDPNQILSQIGQTMQSPRLS